MNTFDFESDLKYAIQNEYIHLGVKINHSKDLNDMLMDYLTVHNKIIQPLRRHVSISAVLQTKLVSHPKKDVVEIIKERLALGLDVNFFQSKKLFQSDFHDHLLFEWFVYHFHLSLKREYKGNFFKKTNSLLFVFINHHQAILLDIDTHRPGVFADEKWLEILDNEFPEILECHIDHSIKEVHPHVTPEQRQAIWSKGYTLGMTKVNGKIIRSPGLGRMASGHSFQVARTTDSIVRWLFEINGQFSQYGKEICQFSGLDPSETRFRVRLGNPTLDVIDEKSNARILSFPETFHITEEKELQGYNP